MQPLIRPEYIDAALEKANSQTQVAELERIRTHVVALGALEAATLQQCVENRVSAGEKRNRTGAPASIQVAGDKAAQDIHKVELRKCRRAETPAQVIESLLALIRSDIEFNRPLLAYIDLPANLALSEVLLAQKAGLQSELEAFLARWQSASWPSHRE